MIEIAYAIHDYYGSYYKYLGVSLFSVMENTDEELHFHILCDNTLTDDARNKIRDLCKSHDKEISFHDIVLDQRISLEELLEAGYSEGILYRLYLPELLPDISKIIYLDCDILANGDIKGLWEMDADGFCAAGRFDPPLLGFVPLPEEKRKKMEPFWEEIDWNSYINSGVLLMNLDRIRREHRLLEEAISFWEKYACSLPDQDAINYVFRGKTAFIPACCNMPNKDCPQVRDGFFFHYTYMGEDADRLDPIDKLYIDYWDRSPFSDGSLGKKEKIGFLRDLKNRSEIYERLQEIRPLSNAETLDYSVSLYLKGDYRACYGMLRSLPDAPVSVLARSLKGLGKTDEAIALLREDLEKRKASSYLDKKRSELELWDLLGELLYEAGRYDEAGEAYKNALYFGDAFKNETAIKALMHLIKCSLSTEDLSGAKKYYSMLFALRPLDDTVKIYGVQIEIAERKIRKQNGSDPQHNNARI